MRPFTVLGAFGLSFLWACDAPTSANSPPTGSAPVMSLVTSASAPSLASATFFGGSGDQSGQGLAIAAPDIYVAGSDESSALVVKYGAPPSGPLWSATLPTSYFIGVALAGGTVYPVGDARPPTCGASDGVGSTEPKTFLARYTSGGTLLGCGSLNYFPYRGNEDYNAGIGVVESGSPFVYAAGFAEQLGFGVSFPFVLTKYDASGAVVDQVTEPGITFGTSWTCCTVIGVSNVAGLVQYGGNLYLAGGSKLTGFGEDAVFRPMLMKYGTAPLTRAWKVRPTDNPGGIFRAVTALGGSIYAVGNTSAAGNADYLIEKYDETGIRIWTVTTGGSADDVLQGVVGVGSRLFAVGYTRSSGSGGADAVILEIDPATGATQSTTLFGGAQDDVANGVATDGTDLYVVGQSRSFASAEGNAVGENDVLLLRYGLLLTVAIDIKPGSNPNSINPASTGVIPVAVLTDASFDAATVDVATVRFGRTGSEAAPAHSALEDVDGDGDLDLVLHFRTQQTGLVCGATSASLTGRTVGGQPIQGSDAVRMVPCR